MKKFFMRLFGIDMPQPVPRPPTDPLSLVYEDAMIVLDRIYAGEPWSRAAFTGTMSQGRWAAAVRLLKDAGILNERGRFIFGPGRDAQFAGVMVRDVINTRRRLAANKNYIAP